jgi:two-component system, cell cycle response regulator DivK
MARILVIEDNAATMKLNALVLQNAGHTVLCAVDAETGLTLARTGQPDLILMDTVLPGMDGLAATALLKTDPTTAAIPVIALSTILTEDDEKNARLAGCGAYIAKPFRRQELTGTINHLLKAAIDALLLKSGPNSATEEP